MFKYYSLTEEEKKFITNFIDLLVEYDVARDIYDEPILDSLNEKIYEIIFDNIETITKSLKESLDNELRMKKFTKLVAQYGIKNFNRESI